MTAVRTALNASSMAEPLLRRLEPEAAGFTLVAVRQDGLAASRGAVDLGEYFLYFSFFLIVAAVMLAASFFKLGIEQRVREVGTLRAVGFSTRTLRRVFIAEGAVLLLVGSVVGVLGALGYAGALVAGLRTWWVGAVGTGPRVPFMLRGPRWPRESVGARRRRLARSSGRSGVCLARHRRALLAGELESRVETTKRTRALAVVAASLLVTAFVVLGLSAAGLIASVEGFFGAGTLLLVSTVTMASLALRRARPASNRGTRLERRGAPCRPWCGSSSGAESDADCPDCVSHVHRGIGRGVQEGLA